MARSVFFSARVSLLWQILFAVLHRTRGLAREREERDILK